MIDPSYVKHVNSISISELKEMLRIINEQKFPEHKKLIEARIEELESNPEHVDCLTEVEEFNIKVANSQVIEEEEKSEAIREKMLKPKAPKAINFLIAFLFIHVVALPILAFQVHKAGFNEFPNLSINQQLYLVFILLSIVSYIYLDVSILRIIKIRTIESYKKIKKFLFMFIITQLTVIFLQNILLEGFNLNLLFESIISQRFILIIISYYIGYSANKNIEIYYTNPEIIMFDKEPKTWYKNFSKEG